jgi:hypothetical protein
MVTHVRTERTTEDTMSTNRPARPDVVIYSQSMVRAQATVLTRGQRKLINQWADAVEARRLARGEDAEDARPTRFAVRVLDRNDVLIGHVTYEI